MANHVLFLVVCITVLPVILSVAGASPSCFPSDQNALLAFKAGVFDFNEGLITWSTSSKSCCSWRGVSCNSAGRVTHLSVTIEGLVVQKPRLVGSTLSDLTELEVLVLQNLVNSNDLPAPAALPGELKSLRKLTTLSLVDSGFGGQIPAEWSEISSLKKLNLSLNSGINGVIPRSFCKLRKLQVFSVGNMWVSPGRLKGHIPACFGSLDIREIDFSNNKLTGIIPSSLKKLRKLASLKLSNNMMGGPIPSSMGCLKELKVLHLQGNSFSGHIPASLWSLANLQDLELGAGEDDSGNVRAPNKELSGGLPTSYRLKALKILRIRGTSIAGPLPPSLGLISQKLTEITLDNNALTGRIPVSLGALKKLTTLNLASNQLKGPIPPSLARPKLSKLSIINLSGNQLSGEIPSFLSKLSLSALDLSNNHLKGMIPSDLGDVLPSGMLKLGSNQLSGAFPPSLWNLRLVNLSHNHLTSLPSGHLPAKHVGSSHLEQLFLDSNELSGQIPAWIFDLSDVLYLNLANNRFVSPLPVIDPNSLSINYLNISRNLFTGTIPDEWANIESLSTLDVSFNQFTGKIPANFTSGSLFFNNLVLSHNNLSGPIPDQIFSSVFFNSLDLSHNNLSGPIPDIFPDTTPFLSSLDLSFNQLSGDIPQRLFNYSAFLGKLKLGHNQFSGPIPSFSGACQPGGNNLNFVALNDNKFTGVLHGAPWIHDCAGKFIVFDISGNGITGPIPDLSSWTQLKVLSLANNKFTGPVPPFLFTGLPSLQVLDLSRNSLSGALPFNNLGGLQSMLNSTGGADLKPMKGGPYYQDGLIFTKVDTVVPFTLTLSATTAIDLSHNALSGLLSEKMGSLMGLHVFDVASNRLSGSLPSSLGKIKGLQILDLSSNAFTGIIPPSLQSFPPTSFWGNAGLCGRPLAVMACH